MTKKNKAKIDRWNKRAKVGDWVAFHSHMGADPQLYKARSEAVLSTSGSPCIWLHDKTGYVLLEACVHIPAWREKPRKHLEC
jgi:hypothetical protein